MESDFDIAINLQKEFDEESISLSSDQITGLETEFNDEALAMRLQAEYEAEIKDANSDDCFIVSEDLKLNNSPSSLKRKMVLSVEDSDLALAMQLQNDWSSGLGTENSENQKAKRRMVFDANDADIAEDDSDFALAKVLQDDWNSGEGNSKNIPVKVHGSSNIIDASWELVDPCPDLHVLFLEFNTAYFWGQLEGVEVRWSPRMTLCAGLCVYEGRGGLCSVRLSHPLLKLRPRKDLVETLLHEMIHAYLFVTQNNKDHDGHGPEFHKHMYRINKLTGTNITVYHSFHQEVALYKQHWWRCDGPCKDRKPFYGWVKRAMNRAPSHIDRWWAQHQQTCGGSFNKVKSPEPPPQKTEKRKATDSLKATKKETNQRDIRTLFSSDSKSTSAAGSKQMQDTFPIQSNKDNVVRSSNIHTINSPLTNSVTTHERFPTGKRKDDTVRPSNIHTINSFASNRDNPAIAKGSNRPVHSPERKKGKKDLSVQRDIRTVFSPEEKKSVISRSDVPKKKNHVPSASQDIRSLFPERSRKLSKDSESSDTKKDTTNVFPGRGAVLGKF